MDTNPPTPLRAEMPIWLQAEPLRPALGAVSPASIPSTVCAHCPAALWYATAFQMGPKMSTRLTCYCRAMNVNTWSADDRNQLTDCDELRMQLLQRDMDAQPLAEASSPGLSPTGRLTQ